MGQKRLTELITIHAAKNLVSELDALAAAMHRSRNYIVNKALRQYLATNAWQIDRIHEGAAAVRDGRVRPADHLFADMRAGMVGIVDAAHLCAGGASLQ